MGWSQLLGSWCQSGLGRGKDRDKRGVRPEKKADRWDPRKENETCFRCVRCDDFFSLGCVAVDPLCVVHCLNLKEGQALTRG